VEVALTSPRGPVYVDIPTDILGQDVALDLTPSAPHRSAADPADIDRAVAAIERAGSIVIWAGGGVVEAEATAELAALADHLAAPVITTFAGRGVAPHDHPWLVGLPPHEPEVAAYVAGADLMLAVGTAFDGPMTCNWTMSRPPTLVSVNVSEIDLTTNFAPDVGVLGDARLVLGELLTRLKPRTAGGSDLGVMRRRTWERLRTEPDGEPALDFLDAVDEAVVGADATVVVDMTIPGYWYGGYGRVARPRALQYPIGWGTLGYALPASVGAAVAGDHPVLVICGDGGFAYAVGELAVLRERDLPVTVLVVDDGGYGMLRYDQVRAGDEPRGVDLARPDFVGLAGSFGIPAVRVGGGVRDLAAALTKALASGGPGLVVLELALTPPRTTSPRWHDPV
jgi:acetolactate synthase-1/2/3 large subunit